MKLKLCKISGLPFYRLGQGIDPLEDHKILADIFGDGEEELKALEKTPWTQKRNIEGSKDFSVAQNNISDVKLEDYKASVHSPSLFNLPDDINKRKGVDEFTDKEIKHFMEDTNPDEFDTQMADAIYSRYQKIKRRENYAKGGFIPSHEYSDDETDMDVRLTKSQKNLEKAVKLQQNLIDMELTKEQDQEFKALIEKENTYDEMSPGKVLHSFYRSS